MSIVKKLRALHRKLPENSVGVDLGCGTQPRNPLGAKVLRGADIVPREALRGSHLLDIYDQQVAGSPLTYSENFADVIYAFDFLEHIPRHSVRGSGVGEFIEVMNDIWRTLKPGGLFLAVTPYFPKISAFTDPTHVNFITKHTHRYFSDDEWARTNGYGFVGSFEKILVGISNPLMHRSLWRPSREELVGIRKPLGDMLRIMVGFLSQRTHVVWVLRKRTIESRGDLGK